jgi:hypothetical protein
VSRDPQDTGSGKAAVALLDETPLVVSARRLFPDLASRRVHFLRFFLHAEAGLDWIDQFWAQHGLVREQPVGLAYLTYVRRGVVHTASLQWRKSGERCADVRLSLDALPPSELRLPRSPKGSLTAHSLASFLREVRLRAGGKAKVASQYGVLVPLSVLRLPMPEGAEVTRLDMRVGNDPGWLKLEFRKRGDRWLAVAEPSHRLTLKFDAVDERFFGAPVSIATKLAELGQEDALDA